MESGFFGEKRAVRAGFLGPQIYVNNHQLASFAQRHLVCLDG